MKEEFRAVVGYEGLYEISNLGNIRSLKRSFVNSLGRVFRVRGRILNQHLNVNGYKYISLIKEGRNKTFSIHGLVAKAFVENPENKRTVNHIDAIKTNNNISNLEWVTQKENVYHAFAKGLTTPIHKQKLPIGEEKSNSKLKEKDVIYIRENTKKNGGNMTIVALSRELSVSTVTIRNVIKRLTWKHVS